MQLASGRDTIANQYVTNFADIWSIVVPSLKENFAKLPTLTAIVRSYLQVLAAIPDTLIMRKAGCAHCSASKRLGRGCFGRR